MKAKKFATQIDEKVLRDLKSYTAQSDRSISSVVTEAVAEYLQRSKVRPAFKTAMDEVLNDHEELLKRLAK
jgi:predicted dinucleotide-binding enzyme